MAKKSHRRLTRSENDQIGCMWGFINIFDFRRGHLSRKLLPDKRRWTSRHLAGMGFSRSKHDLLSEHDAKCQNIDESNESKTHKVGNRRTCVKDLMEDDMSIKEHQLGKQKSPCRSLVEQTQIQCDSNHGRKLGKKIHKQRNKTCKVDHIEHGGHEEPIASMCLEPLHESCRQNSMVEQSSHNLDLAAVMEELCCQFHEMNIHHTADGNKEEGSCNLQKLITSVKHHNQLNELYSQLAQKHSVLGKKLSEGIDGLSTNQKHINDDDMEQLAFDSGRAIHDSNRFMDAIQILNLNKELFLKLLEDQYMRSWQHIQEGVKQDSRVEEEVSSRKSVAGVVKLYDEEIADSIQNDEDYEKQLFCQKQFQKQKHTHNYFFRRKLKFEGGKGNGNSSIVRSDDPQFSNRIVILKPSPSVSTSIQTSAASHSSGNERQIKRVNSHFSFRELKRKLKNVMGESRNEDHLIPIDGSILHNRISSKHQQRLRNEGEVGNPAGDASGADFSTNPHGRRAKSNFEKTRDKISDNPIDSQSEAGHEGASTSTNDDIFDMPRTTAYHKRVESEMYEKAKKHLIEMLTTDENDDEDLSSRMFPKMVPRSLGKILSLPEYKGNLSPISSSGRSHEHSSVNGQMKGFAYDDLQKINENRWQLEVENIASHTGPLERILKTRLSTFGSPDFKWQDLDSYSAVPENFDLHMNMQESVCPIQGDSSPGGTVDIVVITDDACSGGTSLFSDPLTSLLATRNNLTPEKIVVSEEQGYSGHSKQESLLKEIQTPTSSGCLLSSNLTSQKVKDLDDGSHKDLDDGSRGLSPIYACEPHVLEDASARQGSATLQLDEMQKQALQLNFEEQDSSHSVVVKLSDTDIYLRSLNKEKIPIFEYIRVLLQASGLLCWGVEEHMENYHSFSEQQQQPQKLLDPSLLDEVEFADDQLWDRKLLFDCVNELLLEIYEHYVGCSPWVLYVKPNIRPVPVGNDIVREVWKRNDWHIGQQLPPQQHTATLDQIVGKDLTKSGGQWMDLRFNTEAIGVEMTEIIFADLIQDITFEFCTC